MSVRSCVVGDFGSLVSRDRVEEVAASALGLLFSLPAGVIYLVF